MTSFMFMYMHVCMFVCEYTYKQNSKHKHIKLFNLAYENKLHENSDCIEEDFKKEKIHIKVCTF